MVTLLFQGSQEVSRLTRLTGKQWHDNKTAFRPRANQTSWDKRTAERKALAATKAKEKEMKEEKEAERQVRYRATMSRTGTNCDTASCRCHQDEARSQGGARAIREDGREDAQEACRALEEERKAQQDAQVLSKTMILA
jgi:hypothetical protein